MPGQALRKKSVRQKLNPIGVEFKDKNVLLIDDSIVRGTTAKEIVQMARDAGAKNVYLASAAPPVKYPNVYGIDMPSRSELLAFNKDDKNICKEIGADALIYQGLDELKKNITEENKNLKSFDCSCFDGIYVTGGIDENYLNRLESERSDNIKNKDMSKTTSQLDFSFTLSENEEEERA